MTILECLEGLPDDMEFIDLTVSADAIKTVAEIKEENRHDTSDGYYRKELFLNYGQRKVLSIRCKWGGVFNQKV